MFQNLKTYIVLGNSFVGIEHTTKNGQSVFNCSILKKAKKEIVLSDSFTTKSLEAALKKIPKKYPVFVIMNNEHVLTKTVEITDPASKELTILNQAFPNIDISDFYYEIITGKTQYFTAICRIEYLNNTIETYSSEGYNLIGFSLGNSCITGLSSYFEGSEIQTSNAVVRLSNYQILSIQPQDHLTEKKHKINGLEIKDDQVLTFAGILGVLLNPERPIANFSEKCMALKREFQNSRFSAQFLKFGLAFTLLILLINFLFFNIYFEKVERLKQVSQMNQIAKQDVVALNDEIIISQKLVADILKNSSSRSSYYINDIVSHLPSSVLLSEINFQPIEKRIKENTPISLTQDVITIFGISNESNMFSEWIGKLEGLHWVSSVKVVDYSDSTKKTSDFGMKIYLKNEQ